MKYTILTRIKAILNSIAPCPESDNLKNLRQLQLLILKNT